MKFYILLLSITISMVGIARATVTIDMSGDLLRTSGGAAIPTSSLILILADTTGNGFGTLQGGSSVGVNQLVAGTDDRIVGVFDMSVWGTAGVFQTPTFIPDLATVTGWTAGDPLALVWLPTLTPASPALVAGSSYGIFAPATPFTGSGGDPWITPLDGTSGSLQFFATGSTLGTATFSNTAAEASFVVAAVPEPSRALLLLVGLGVCVLRRRRAAV